MTNTAGILGGERTKADRLAAVWAAAALVVALLCAVALLAADVMLQRHRGYTWGEAIGGGLALLFVVRGFHLGRPLTVGHAVAAVAALLLSMTAQSTEHPVAGAVLLASTGALLMLPGRSRPDPELLPVVSRLVEQTSGDPLAPFAMHSTKSYYLDERQQAAIGYRTRAGIAVVSGDPVGDPATFPTVAREFVAFCRRHGWRLAVLGASDGGRDLWTSVPDGPKLKSVAFGRDVVLDVPTFSTAGRTFRNLRQAVSRARNAGVTTEIMPESGLSRRQRTELLEVVARSPHGKANRGFSMILDHVLDARTPGLLLVVARGRSGELVAFQRYGTADDGREITLDVPWRRPGAPNGVDELMTMAMVDWARTRGARRVSLALAAFPDLFDTPRRTAWQHLAHRLIHLGDRLIAVESLYAYLRKFHALGGRRYAILGLSYAVFAASAMFTLEFVPHRREY